jgi:flavin reductase (DIM6/NTAB) family NADH-FMN oxidoreductase RutF
VPADPLSFRRAAGLFATGVTIVTTQVDGVDHAMTANSFTSVSLAPLLVLVSVDKSARWHAAVSESKVFGVSVLAADQAATSRMFATRGRPLDARSAGIGFHQGPETGVVLFDHALATFECSVSETHDAGDHTLVVGAVLGFATPAPDEPPLLFFRGEYRTLT